MAKKNWSISTVATAPSPATSGTSLVVESGHGARFADDEPAIIFPMGEQPDSTNAEIVMITNISTDTFTIDRAEEGTTARTIVVGDVIMQGWTAKDWNDLVAAAFTWKGAWATSTAYVVNDAVQNDGSGYICTSAHTSGASTEPGVGASWTTVWSLFVEGVGGNSIQVDCSGGTSDTYGVLAGLVNSSNTIYTVSLGSYISGSLRVYLNGQLQTQGSSEDWVETTPASGTFTFNTAPATGDIVTATYQFSTGTTGNADTLDGLHSSSLALKSEWANGWISAGETWTYASADAPTFVITVPSGAASRYSVGMKIKLTQTTVKYFIITAVSDTTLTVYGGTDYTLVDAAISANYYSMVRSPLGFPVNPTKWQVEVTDVTQRVQTPPTAAQWYNLGSISISVPIGVWEVSYQVELGADKAAATGLGQVQSTLSTANNSESDVDFSTVIDLYGASGILGLHTTMNRHKTLAITSKTSYYLNTRAIGTVADIYNNNNISKLIIRAVCAYL